MKKILIAMMMTAAVTGNANAFDFEVTGAVITQQVVTSVLKQIIPQTVNDGSVILHTGKITSTGQTSKCWTKNVYDSQGNVKVKLVCY